MLGIKTRDGYTFQVSILLISYIPRLSFKFSPMGGSHCAVQLDFTSPFSCFKLSSTRITVPYTVSSSWVLCLQEERVPVTGAQKEFVNQLVAPVSPRLSLPSFLGQVSSSSFCLDMNTISKSYYSRFHGLSRLSWLVL